MSWKSCIKATFAAALAAAVVACDDDSTGPDPGPISIAGDYAYTFDVDNGEEGDDEVACAGQGTVTVTQMSDSTFTAETAADGSIECTGFGETIALQSGAIGIDGVIDDGDVTFQFPFLGGSDLCEASGEIVGDPAIQLSGTATCVLDPVVFGVQGDPITLTGAWTADRVDG